MSLRTLALAALGESDLQEKLTLVAALKVEASALAVDPEALLPEPATLPGRPAQPLLIEPAQVPRRSVHTLDGRAALIHAICHIEFNAINLALDAIWRFAGMPEDFYRDWLRVAIEEAHHFSLLHEHLQSLAQDERTGVPRWRYGSFAAHDGLWAMCEKTRHDITARMALVPRTLEARGLDATPLIQTRLRQSPRPTRWPPATSSTSSCATRSATWRLATTGTAGCANARAWSRWRTTKPWRGFTRRRG